MKSHCLSKGRSPFGGLYVRLKRILVAVDPLSPDHSPTLGDMQTYHALPYGIGNLGRSFTLSFCWTQTGQLKRSTYWEYIREAAGVWQVFLIIISMAGGQVINAG